MRTAARRSEAVFGRPADREPSPLPALLILALVLLLSTGASAQKQDKKPKPPPVDVKGTVQQVAPGGVSVLSPTNETWLVQIPPDAKVVVTGTAEPDLLRRDVFVRFTALVNKRGEIADPVRQLTIIDPGNWPGRRLGTFRPGQDVPAAAGAAAGAAGAEGPMPDLGGAPPEADQALLDMRGRITSYGDGRMTLDVPPGPAFFFKRVLPVELADSFTLELDVSNYSLAQPGDNITGKGVQLGPHLAQVKEVSITLSAPVVNTKKRAERERRPSRTATEQEERNPFEVARQMEQEEEATKPGQPAPVAQGQDATQPAPREEQPSEPPPEPAGASQPTADRLVAMLTPEPDTILGPDIRVRVGASPAVTFTRCKPGVTHVDLRGEFGGPDSLFDLRGELPIGRDGALEKIEWEMWQYGQMRLFLDNTGMVRYRQVR